ncbi:MAG: DUF3575 domain-containing protein [Rikenellaceae bacterium]
MKRLLLLLFALPVMAMGQVAETQIQAQAQAQDSELQLVAKIYYDRGIYIPSDAERAKIDDLVSAMRADTALKIHIVGYCDKWGGKEVNDRFSYTRAKYIADWMCSRRVASEQILFYGRSIDTLAPNDAEARRVEFLQVVKIFAEAVPQSEVELEDARASEPIGDVDAEMQVEPEPTPEPTSEVNPEPATSASAVADSKRCRFEWNYLTPRTNLFYWVGGLMNLGVEYKRPESDFGFLINGGYSPFGSTYWNHNFGGWFVAPEVRYYLPSSEQWFVGVQLLAGGYNLKLADTGSQGSMIGGGVMGGYKLTLSNSFDMDFTLGLGYDHLWYDNYYHDEPSETNPYVEKSITRNRFLPIQAGVNLIWKIN